MMYQLREETQRLLRAEPLGRAADASYDFWVTTRKTLRRWRLNWRYRNVYGAPYPPFHHDTGEKYSWLRDFRAGWRNPPRRRR
jgi:hypothetical protein